jgi:hypothetical protein
MNSPAMWNIPMYEPTKTTLLAIGIAELWPGKRCFSIYTASSLHETVATMRLICVDLLVVGLEDPELDVWELMDRVLTVWPQQRWLLASHRITEDDEVLARSLGALLVLNELPTESWLMDFVASLKRRDLSKRIPIEVSARAASPTSSDAVAVETL